MSTTTQPYELSIWKDIMVQKQVNPFIDMQLNKPLYNDDGYLCRFLQLIKASDVYNFTNYDGLTVEEKDGLTSTDYIPPATPPQSSGDDNDLSYVYGGEDQGAISEWEPPHIPAINNHGIIDDEIQQIEDENERWDWYDSTPDNNPRIRIEDPDEYFELLQNSSITDFRFAHCVYSNDKNTIITEATEDDYDDNYYTIQQGDYIGICLNNDSNASAIYNPSEYTWYKRIQNCYEEQKWIIIGSDKMTSKNKASDIHLIRNINGSNEIEFTLYSQYFDEDIFDYAQNDFIDSTILTVESHVKLFYKNQWYDFIINNIEENSQEHTFVYKGTDLWINQLGKTGYNITLNNNSNNNTGTVLELAEIILDGSDWELDRENSDNIYQFNTEVLYPIIIEEGFTAYKTSCNTDDIRSHTFNGGETIYVPYSVINNQKPFFQFIWHDPTGYDSGDEYQTNEDGVILETPNSRDAAYYGGWYLEDVVYEILDDSLIIKCDSISIYNNTFPNITLKFRGSLPARQQRTQYDILTGNIVNLYQKDGSIYYGYNQIKYFGSNYKLNYVVDGTSPTSHKGWVANNTNVKIEAQSYPALPQVGKNYLHISASNMDINYPIYNNIIESLTQEYENISVGQKFLLRIKGYNSTEAIQQQTPITNYNQWDVNFYEYTINNGSDTIRYKPNRTNPYLTKTTEWILDEGSFKSVLLDSTVNDSEIQKYYWYNPNDDTYYRCKSYDDYTPSRTYYEKVDGYYYTVFECNKSISAEEIKSKLFGLFFSIPNGNYYFESVEFCKYNPVPGGTKIVEDSEIITIERSYAPGEYIGSIKETKYYYYKPDSNYSSVDDIVYDYMGTEENDEYEPVYNNFEKIKTIEEENSNRYNLLQTLAEQYECWARFDVNYNTETGQVLKTNWKKVTPLEFDPHVTYYISYDKIKEFYIPFNQFNTITKDSVYNKNTRYFIYNNGIYINYIIDDEYDNVLGITQENFKNNLPLYIYQPSEGKYISAETYNKNEQYYRHKFNKFFIDNPDTKLYALKQVSESQEYYLFTPNRDDKTVSYHTYIEQNNYAGIKYGLNLESIQREVVSEEIVTQMYVQSNNSEFADGGVCSIAYAKDNPSAQDFILDFTYYINQGLLSYDVVMADLYGGQVDLGDSIYEGFDYYGKLKRIYNNYNENIDRQSIINLQLIKLNADIEPNRNIVLTAPQLIEENLSHFDPTADRLNEDGLFPFSYADAKQMNQRLSEFSSKQEAINNYNWIESHKEDITTAYLYEAVKSDEACYKLLVEINTWVNNLNEAQRKLNDCYSKKQLLNNELSEIKNQNVGSDVQLKQLNDEFFQLYSHYLREGTWNDDDQYDNELYYYDALGVMATSRMPQIQYTINIIDVSSLEGYEDFDFSIGDKTTVEDTKFFGYTYTEQNGDIVKTPYKEEVIISEIEYCIDNPSETKITVQNYKTKFEDLFQRIAATVQQLEYSQGAYDRAARLITNNTLDSALLQNTLLLNDFDYLNSDYLSINNSGITIKDQNNTNNLVKIAPGGLYTSTDGGSTWNHILSYQGLETSALCNGTIDIAKISIYDGSDLSFKWDKIGLSAYNSENGYTNYSKFVRLDSNGIYGVNSDRFLQLGYGRDIQYDSSLEYYYRDENGNYVLFVGEFVLPSYLLFPSDSLVPLNWDMDEIYYIYDNSIWTPNDDGTSMYNSIKENSDFGLTYDGFFLKSGHDDGYIEFSDTNDIKVIQYKKEKKEGEWYYDEINRIEIGLLDEYDFCENISAEAFGRAESLFPSEPIFPDSNLLPSNTNLPTTFLVPNSELVPQLSAPQPYLAELSYDITEGYSYSVIKPDNVSVSLVLYELEEDESGETIYTNPIIVSDDNFESPYNGAMFVYASTNEFEGEITIKSLVYDAGGRYGIRINDIDGNPVMVTDDDGKLWLKNELRIGPEIYSPRARFGVLSTNNNVSKIMSINNINGEETFRIYDNGQLYAVDAILSGTITATAGEIASFTIEENKLYNVNIDPSDPGINTGVVISPLGIGLGRKKTPSGEISVEDRQFVVTSDGVLTANNANILGTLHTSVFEKGSTRVSGGTSLFKNASIIDTTRSHGKIIYLLNDDGYDNFNSGDYISIIGSQQNDESNTHGNIGTENCYKIADIVNTDESKYIQLVWDGPDNYINDWEYLMIQFSSDTSYKNDWIIGVNSNDTWKPFNLAPNSLSFNEIDFSKADDDPHTIDIKNNVVLGDLTHLNLGEDIKNGLYAENAYLTGSFYANKGGSNEIQINNSGFSLGDAIVYNTANNSLSIKATDITIGGAGLLTYRIEVASSQGTTTKESIFSTDLTATVYHGDRDVTQLIGRTAPYNNLEINWYQNDTYLDTGYQYSITDVSISSTLNYVVKLEDRTNIGG